MSKDFNPSDWITTKEAAELTGYHVVHIRRLIRDSHINGRKFGRDWMVSRESLQAYVEEMERLGSTKHDPWRTGARCKVKKQSRYHLPRPSGAATNE